MSRSRYLIPCAAGALLLGGYAFADTAEPKATGSVAYRQHSMSAMAEHMAALKVVLIDQPALIGEAGVHAAAIAGTSQFIPAMFPKDGNTVDTWALAAVWDQPADFAAPPSAMRSWRRSSARWPAAATPRRR